MREFLLTFFGPTRYHHHPARPASTHDAYGWFRGHNSYERIGIAALIREMRQRRVGPDG